MSRDTDLDAWRLFVESVKAGSVAAACDHLNIEPSTASRVIRALEKDCGFPLFHRSSRPVRLTSNGRIAYEEALKLLDTHMHMMLKLKDNHNSMQGKIRIATHQGLASMEVIPKLIEFQHIYPDISFEITELTAPAPKGFVDANGESVDIIIGYGSGEVDGAVARFTGDMPFVPVASALYVRKFGMPRNPEDAARHTGIVFSSHYRDIVHELSRNGMTVQIKWKNILKCPSVMAAKQACLLSGGVYLGMPLFHCHEDLKNGTLVRVFEGWNAKPLQCYIYVNQLSWSSHRVQFFTEWMTDKEREMIRKLRSGFEL